MGILVVYHYKRYKDNVHGQDSFRIEHILPSHLRHVIMKALEILLKMYITNILRIWVRLI